MRERVDGQGGVVAGDEGRLLEPQRRPEGLPAADEALASHLGGRATLGIYPLLRGDTCELLACDFDKGSWALDSLAYLDVCHQNGVPDALERSRSANGGHVWVFLDGPVPATDARAMGAALLRLALSRLAELDLASHDRFFPSQDFLPKARFGNLIALPLQGECVTPGTTMFLDPTTMAPWPDQWACLSTVDRMSAKAVTELASTLRPIDADPLRTLADLARQGEPPPPAKVGARQAGMPVRCVPVAGAQPVDRVRVLRVADGREQVAVVHVSSGQRPVVPIARHRVGGDRLDPVADVSERQRPAARVVRDLDEPVGLVGQGQGAAVETRSKIATDGAESMPRIASMPLVPGRCAHHRSTEGRAGWFGLSSSGSGHQRTTRALIAG